MEKLKYENTGLDSKLKWHLSKLKIETEARETAEKKIEELNAEVNQLKLKEINRAKEEVEVERNMLAGEFSSSISQGVGEEKSHMEQIWSHWHSVRKNYMGFYTLAFIKILSRLFAVRG